MGENKNPDHSSIEKNSMTVYTTLSQNSTACLRHNKKPTLLSVVNKPLTKRKKKVIDFFVWF